MLITGKGEVSMEKYIDMIIFHIKDGIMSKHFPNISITVPKILLMRVQLVMNLKMQLEFLVFARKIISK